MYVCMYVCVCIYNIHLYVHMLSHTCIYVNIHAYIHMQAAKKSVYKTPMEQQLEWVPFPGVMDRYQTFVFQFA